MSFSLIGQSRNDFMRRHAKLGLEFVVNPDAQSSGAKRTVHYHRSRRDALGKGQWVRGKGNGFLVSLGHHAHRYTQKRARRDRSSDARLVSYIPAKKALDDVNIPYRNISAGLEIEKPSGASTESAVVRDPEFTPYDVDTSNSLDLLNAIQCIRDGRSADAISYLKVAEYDPVDGPQAAQMLEQLTAAYQDAPNRGYLELATIDGYVATDNSVWIDGERQEVTAPCGFNLAEGSHDVVIADGEQHVLHYRIDLKEGTRTTLSYSLSPGDSSIEDAGNRWCEFKTDWLAADARHDSFDFGFDHIRKDVHVCVIAPRDTTFEWNYSVDNVQHTAYRVPGCIIINLPESTQGSTVMVHVKCVTGAGKFEISMGRGMCRVHT
jgi:hypothetical protein